MDPIKKHPIIAWFCSNSVVANILLLIILTLGVHSAINVRKEAFPSFEAESVRIKVPFRGGTPEDVERGVSIKIEEALQGIEGIDHISSTSTESSASITVDAIEDYPIQKLLDEIKIQVDAISSFPEEAEKPVLSERKRSHDILRVDVHGNVSEELLKETARTLRDDLLKLESITLVETTGTRDYEISIEVSETQLRLYNLTFDEVSAAISSNSIDLSAGVVRSDSGDISVRSKSQAYVAEDFAKIPLRTTAEGTRIYLGDVADIRDGFVDQKKLSRFDGEPTVAIQVVSEGRGDIIVIAKEAAEFVSNYAETHGLPAGITLTSWDDGSEPIRSRLSLLISNGIFGCILVLIVLALFLNLRLAFWVALGIPISIAGALACFPIDFIDISLNQLTAFAFIIVLGIIVDDAIVIGESIYTEKEAEDELTEKHRDLHSTVKGVSRVVTPATFGVLTTIAAFYPLTQVTGRMGNVFGQIATAVILCLIFSLIESKLILPSHLNHIKVNQPPKNFISKKWANFQGGIARGLNHFVTKIYQPAIRLLIPYRYITLAAFIAVLLLVGGLIPSGNLRFVFFPTIYRDSISANLELEQGLPVDYLHENADRITAALQEAVRELEEKSGDTIIRHISVSASSNVSASIAAELTMSETRSISTADIVKAWRAKVRPIAGAKGLTFSGAAGPRGQGLNIQLVSESLEDLHVAAEAMKEKIATYAGVFDIQDTFDSGRPEIQVSITPEGEAAGFDKRTLANNIRSAFFGKEAQRIQRGRDEVKVMVRYPYEDRTDLETFRSMRIRANDGTAVPLSIVAETKYGDSLASIERSDFNRIVTVKAEIDKTITTGDEVLALLAEEYFPTFLAEHPNISINLFGEAEQRGKSMSSLKSGFMLSIILIYILIAVPLKSYIKPLFIMSVIPFGIIGALLGHYLIGISVSILSIFGILALSGIVVNDSLVLVYRIDDLKRETKGLSHADMIVRAGGERFRAILLTTLTTFVGLIPLLAETSVQAQFLKPMAVSVGFGVMFATGITLVLLPMILLIAEDCRIALSNSWGAWKKLLRL
ncbi:MAG: efflux RND transporter permease subunit [Opitutales bacterium]|jgi:multidrug efflux pump subunit AcrB|nr:efflux RND transporter permease subunit [Opitutales bacterium]MDP4777021.1 efflux RND transporter permease subunit [Opitutales bacterium]MDP4882682.1 efflux RND transporter permease subunit [Opitutales bacterium]MDP5080979.1 efflux RND transporter permease subunit [Opitutales bacterium]